MLRVLTLSTLFPDATCPRLGCFVERQTLGLAAHPDIELRIVSPLGLPPWPLSRHPHYRARAGLPEAEDWQGVPLYRPRFLHIPGTQGRFDAGALTRALLPLLGQIRRDFAFDVIDAEYFFPDGPAAVAIGKAFGVPVSIKARGSDIHLWGRSGPTAAQVIAAGRAADGLLAVSQPLKADMAALGMPEDRISVHYTGVDRAAFRPMPRADAKHALGIAGALVLTAGALVPRKGQTFVIDAVAQLPGVQLVLAGDGPDRAALERQAERSGVADRTVFLGNITHEALAQWMAAADVMALATSSEGLANVWVEALACGTPVVTTNVGGAGEVVTGPDAGRLVARDARAFAGAIAAILADPPAPAAVRAFAARFDWDTNRDALYAHLARLVSSHSLR